MLTIGAEYCNNIDIVIQIFHEILDNLANHLVVSAASGF